jgi:glucuronoarabinoxylan endo-1,4-beta-xylanase
MVIASCTTAGSSSGTGGSKASGGNNSGSGGNGSGGTTAASGGTTGSGGVTSSGGTTGTGGSTVTGGTTSSGGTTSAGGTTSTGGSKATGGTTSSSGTTSDGGTTSAGGSSAAGGATNTGGTKATGGTTSAGGRTGVGGDTSAGGTTGAGGGTSTGVTVQLDQTEQTIEGFGLNTALGGGTVPWDTFYSTSGTGIGLSIVRVGMNSNGSLSGSVPAASYNAKVIGSAWTAPANCKDNNSENNGGHLLTSCYDSWSTTLANFAKSQGLYAMSVSNEPEFASCGTNDPCNGTYSTMLYTAKEMVAFLKVAGPKIQQAGAKVIAPETSEWLHLWSNISAGPDPGGKNSSDPLKCGCFGMTIDSATAAKCASTCTQGNGYDYGHYMAADSAAWAAFDIIGTHQYDAQLAYAWPSDVNGGKRNKEIWQTEMSGVKWWPEQGPSSDINNGVAVAGWIHSALVVGQASAWLYWWYSQTSDNEGVVLGSTDTKRHWTLGNYSKFVRPGYVMVDVTGNSNTNLLLSAFKGTDGTVVVVAINKGTAAATVPITIAGGTAPASCTPNVTSSSANLTAGTAVTVTGGTFTASLAAATVTTFVCK